jgi:hypothetical protein
MVVLHRHDRRRRLTWTVTDFSRPGLYVACLPGGAASDALRLEVEAEAAAAVGVPVPPTQPQGTESETRPTVELLQQTDRIRGATRTLLLGLLVRRRVLEEPCELALCCHSRLLTRVRLWVETRVAWMDVRVRHGNGSLLLRNLPTPA